MKMSLQNFMNQIYENNIYLLVFSNYVGPSSSMGNDWSKCAVDVPDSYCHWYVASPDNTFGDGFNWEKAPWFNVNGLNDIGKIERKTVVEKLQK